MKCDMEKTIDALDDAADKITNLRVKAAATLNDKEKLIESLTEECAVLKDAIRKLEESDKAFTKAYMLIVDQFPE